MTSFIQKQSVVNTRKQARSHRRGRKPSQMERSVDAYTVRRTLQWCQDDELPRRRIDCLLLLATGSSHEQAAETCHFTVAEVREMVRAVFSRSLAHAILFGQIDAPIPL